MPHLPYLQIGLGVALGVLCLILVSAVRIRRRRALLTRMVRRYSLAFVTGKVAPQMARDASLVRGSRRATKLGEVLVGSDDDGKFYLGLRRIRGLWRRYPQQILFFRIEGASHLRGFCIDVGPAARPGRRAKWWRRRGDRGASASEVSDASNAVRLSWETTRPYWGNQKALSMAARVLYHTATVGEDDEAIPLHVEIDEDRVVLFCPGRLDGKRLERFFADALKLRALLLVACKKARALSPGAGATTVTGASPTPGASSIDSEEVTVLSRSLSPV